jgi:hypothetical protein
MQVLTGPHTHMLLVQMKMDLIRNSMPRGTAGLSFKNILGTKEVNSDFISLTKGSFEFCTETVSHLKLSCTVMIFPSLDVEKDILQISWGTMSIPA